MLGACQLETLEPHPRARRAPLSCTVSMGSVKAAPASIVLLPLVFQKCSDQGLLCPSPNIGRVLFPPSPNMWFVFGSGLNRARWRPRKVCVFRQQGRVYTNEGSVTLNPEHRNLKFKMETKIVTRRGNKSTLKRNLEILKLKIEPLAAKRLLV
uniref:Uncharacterized protein n=1 Tax=Gouania willdenowi TaxID=441366 RepID=A0A8C5EL30_GOUWI